MHRVATTILVDSSGRLLLQLGDGSTTKDPHRWGPTRRAGRAGEHPHDAAVRELEEETGLRADQLKLFWSGLDRWGTEFHFYWGPTTASQEDVLCNEGAAMRFVDAALISGLDLTQLFAVVFSPLCSLSAVLRSLFVSSEIALLATCASYFRLNKSRIDASSYHAALTIRFIDQLPF